MYVNYSLLKINSTVDKVLKEIYTESTFREYFVTSNREKSGSCFDHEIFFKKKLNKIHLVLMIFIIINVKFTISSENILDYAYHFNKVFFLTTKI